MALDRDDVAARATAARAALLSLCDALSALVPVAPASGAPLAAPSRPEPVAVFTCPKCGSNEFGTSNCTSHYSEWVGHCDKCRFSWPREKDDAKYFAAPSPAATPAAWVPSVGDVVDIGRGMYEVVYTGHDAERNEVKGFVLVDRATRSGQRATTWDARYVAPLTYLRRATSSERAAAGLPVDEAKESAAKPVDRVALAKAMRDAALPKVTGYRGSDELKWDALDGDVRAGWLAAADAAIAFMAKAPAFDRAEFNEAQEREAARKAWRNDDDMGIDDEDAYIAGWLARARVAAKGGA